MKRTLSVLLVLALAVPVFATGCGPKKPDSPFTTQFELTGPAIDSFVANDTAETAMCGGPLYPGSRMLPAQNTAEFDKARAEKVTALVTESAALAKACEDAQPAMAKVRADYVNYLDALKTADDSTVTYAGASLQALVRNTLKQAVAQAQYQALSAPGTKPTKAFTTAFMNYLGVVKSVEMAGLYLEDLNQIAGFSAIALQQYADNGKAKTANAEFDAAMEKDFAAAATALEPVAEKLAAVDDGLKRISSADHYFASEAVGYMDSEVAKLKPIVDGLEARDGFSAQDVADTKTLYEGYAWWAGELRADIESVDAADLVQARSPRRDFNPFGVQEAYAAEGYTPGADYGKAVAVLSEAPKPAEPEQGYLSKAWGGVKSAFGKVKTGAGVVIDTAGVGVQTITAVGCGIWYGNSTKDTADVIAGACKDAADAYNKGLSGSSTIKTAGEYIEGVEKGAGEAAGAAVGGALSWGAKQAGAGKDTQKTIASWSSWAANGLTKTTVGMFTGMAKGIYKVGDKGSSTADVVSGIVDIGLGAIGGSKVIIKASQIPGLTKGAFSGLKNLGQAMLNLGKSAANAAERKELETALRATLAAKGLAPAAVEKLIGDSIKIEIAEQTAKALAATRGQIMKNLRDLIAAGGSQWWADLKGTIASSWSDLVKKGFSNGLQGYLDAGTTVMGASVADYVENLVAAGVTDAWLTDFVNQALAIAPDPEQVDGTYKGTMLVTKIDIPDSAAKTADDAKCLDIYKQLEGQTIPLTLKVDASGGRVTMEGQGGNGSGSCAYKAGTITMHVANQGSTITFTGTVKLRKEGGVAMSGSWKLPYKGTPITMMGTWTATKGK
ncbi:MAG: hypothetical protein CVT67_10355 [Actinobacteria bacterium HGW-Actinobacteria-7]|nr:MAG: hypothetical protein CVT67_10355 [Actinobacteria bacterium HGW-Actinobacteria-7]